MVQAVPVSAPFAAMTTPRLLLLTASFGDGHNSAARGLAEALRREAGDTVRVDVRDFIREAQPLVGRLLEKSYAFMITHAPWAWRKFYQTAGPLPLEEDPAFALHLVRQALADDLRRDRPAAVVCTFPLYPHLLHRLLGRSELPVHTVVTDSISIHPVWRCDSVRTYFAADEVSASLLRPWAQAGSTVVDAGFPVHPAFADLPAHPAGDTPRTALFFPAGGRTSFARSLHSLLDAGPRDLELTIVLGRQAARLGPVAREIIGHFGHRSLMWWGTQGLVLIESTIFLLALLCWFYLRGQSELWPPDGRAPDWLWGSLTTALLILSLWPNHLVKQAAERLDLSAVRRWIVVMTLLGMAVLVLRVYEFIHLNTHWQAHAYGSIVWLILGLHTVHLITDTWDTAVLAVLMHTGPLEGRRFVDVSENALYWVFVVLSWLPLYGVLYVGPRVP